MAWCRPPGPQSPESARHGEDVEFPRPAPTSCREGCPGQRPDDIPRVTPAELTQRLAGPNPPVVLDVRSRSEYARDGVRIPGSIRVLPDQVTEWAADRLRDQPYVLYCT